MEITTPLSAEEVKERLLAEADNVGLPFPFLAYHGPFRDRIEKARRRPGHKPWMGTVSRYGFQLQMRSDPVDPVACICTGAIRETDSGCRIRLSFGVHPATWMLFLFALGVPGMGSLIDPASFPWRVWAWIGAAAAAVIGLVTLKVRGERDLHLVMIERAIRVGRPGADRHPAADHLPPRPVRAALSDAGLAAGPPSPPRPVEPVARGVRRNN